MRRFHKAALLVCWIVLASACATSGSGGSEAPDARERIVSSATAQVGAPYRYEGADRRGFDDSGLVHFAYSEAGFEIPRYTKSQLRAGQPIRFSEARPGDLLFYRIRQARTQRDNVLHVGLYVGDGDMVHSTLDNDEVTVDRVDTGYWLQRLVAVIKVLP